MQISIHGLPDFTAATTDIFCYDCWCCCRCCCCDVWFLALQGLLREIQTGFYSPPTPRATCVARETSSEFLDSHVLPPPPPPPATPSCPHLHRFMFDESNSLSSHSSIAGPDWAVLLLLAVCGWYLSFQHLMLLIYYLLLLLFNCNTPCIRVKPYSKALTQ